ncbi:MULTISPECIES: hypothetical protein [Streptomyces]|uniref:hypothetical protein n=1 Tax=Streptomyces TaxID=1883 RepID=UPI002F4060DA
MPDGTSDWLDSVVLVHRLREVSVLTGFTRIEALEWLPEDDGRTRRVTPLSRNPSTWVPCAELRGEGVFLALREHQVAESTWSSPSGGGRPLKHPVDPATCSAPGTHGKPPAPGRATLTRWPLR